MPRSARFFHSPTPGHRLGLEYQIWDDNQPRHAGKKLAASYSLIVPNERRQMRPLDEFNRARILVRGVSVERWLNRARVLAFDRSIDDFRSLVARSTYSDIDGFAQAPDCPSLASIIAASRWNVHRKSGGKTHSTG